jgi:hypothetical protein
LPQSSSALVIAESLTIDNHRVTGDGAVVRHRDRLSGQLCRDSLPAFTDFKKSAVWDDGVSHFSTSDCGRPQRRSFFRRIHLDDRTYATLTHFLSQIVLQA